MRQCKQPLFSNYQHYKSSSVCNIFWSYRAHNRSSVQQCVERTPSFILTSLTNSGGCLLSPPYFSLFFFLSKNKMRRSRHFIHSCVPIKEKKMLLVAFVGFFQRFCLCLFTYFHWFLFSEYFFLLFLPAADV